jgi:hypothetical protein
MHKLVLGTKSRIHLNQFRHLNLISSTDFWLCTDSYARRNKVLATSSICVRTLKIYSYIPTLWQNVSTIRTYLSVHSTYVHMCGTSMTKSSGLFCSFWDLDFLTFTKSTITRPKITFRQHVKVPTYSTNRGLSKNAIKKVVIPIGSKDMVFAKSLWRTGQVYSIKLVLCSTIIRTNGHFWCPTFIRIFSGTWFNEFLS